MKFGIRTPSLKRRISARTSVKRYLRHSVGLKMPRGYGFITNPKKALYNKVYNRTSISVDKLLKTPKVKNNNKTLNTKISTNNGKWLKYIFISIFILPYLKPSRASAQG